MRVRHSQVDAGHERRVWTVQRCVSDDVENGACGCVGACEHTVILSEVVIPALRPGTVRVRPLDKRGLVEMAFGRGLGPLLAAVERRAAFTRPLAPDELDDTIDELVAS